ncbi:hypothetical protein COLU111180_15955 [Cohnella lubricantis]|uniref:Tetratricopeptide repeat protein n=1 Tax=Cohnella lubricantis TaxID=2163172 RepID=A0A841TL67_9BACL|nr:hypothetical protein [Cohnella lubricantis]MBB6679677.1 hypothetical protein [Cohnella lubricantis]MBP2119919.1 tetratricopeptide (TPR) repeat protein [Cohnella lubricantis]
MIEQWFAAMNDTLDSLLERYPNASKEEKNALDEQWNVLKTLSDVIIESWLGFEDKMAYFRTLKQEHEAGFGIPNGADALFEPYMKGMGYFKLHMYAEGAVHFEETLMHEPELNVARLFLAMCRMHMGQFLEAQRHFQLIAALGDDRKLQAIAFNALGCIQAVFANLQQAELYFHKAMETDPAFEDPRRNLASCRNRSGQMQLLFGSSEIQALVQA